MEGHLQAETSAAVRVCMSFVALNMLYSRCHSQALAKKTMIARRRRRRMFVAEQSRRCLVFSFSLSILLFNCCAVNRSLCAKERSGEWFEHIINGTFTHNDWISNFRMSRGTFLYICNQIHHLIKKEDTTMRPAITVEHRLALTLYYLPSNSDFRTIGNLFGVSKSTVCIVVKDVCAAIVKIVLPNYLTIPTSDHLNAVIQGFEKQLGFPQCAGVIDGSHIPIISPSECPADYHNRKGWHSIILQGTVNHLGQFIDINVGWPGRVHDARVFSNSTLFKRGQNGTLFPCLPRTISGKSVPILLLGDPAYPLLPWLMKAFPDTGRLSQQQKTFNYRLSRARVVVEHAYGRLKGRWRCLLKRNDIFINDVPVLVAACCTLHNICEIRGDQFIDDWMLENSDHSDSNSSSSSSNSSSSGGGGSGGGGGGGVSVDCDNGKSIRDALMTYFSE